MSKDKAYSLIAIGFVVGIASIAFFIAGMEMLPRNNAVATAISSQVQPKELEPKLSEGHTWLAWSRGYVYAEDTLAQWLMALLGLVSTVASLLGLFFIVRTFKATRDTARAAIKANEQARDFFASENRPWIKITATYVHTFRDEDSGECTYQIEIALDNVGHVPAIGISEKIDLSEGEESPSLQDINAFAANFSRSIPGDADLGLFPGDKTKLEPYTPSVSRSRRYAIVCVAYRSSLNQEKAFHTACLIDLHGSALDRTSLSLS